MSLSINNNITALNAWRNLKKTDSNMSSAMEKLSSGLRINKAADDPAGLVISEKMRAQLAGLSTAQNNSAKAINMVQTAEGSLDRVQSLLDKMRQLALDSANSGVNDSATLKANQDELDASISSITRIASYTQFGTKNLLDGTLGNTFSAVAADVSAASFGGVTGSTKSGTVTLTLNTAAAQATTGPISFTAAQTNGLATVNMSLSVNGVSIAISAGSDIAAKVNGYQTRTGVAASLATNTGLTLTSVAYGSSGTVAYVGGVSGATASVAAFGTDAKATASYADGTTQVYSQGQGLTLSDGAGDTIVLTSGYGAGATGTATNVGTLTANSASFQIGANGNQTVSLSIQSTKASALGLGATYTDTNGASANVNLFTNLAQLGSSAATGGGGVYSQGVFVSGGSDGIAQAVGVIDKAIDQVSTIRGSLGAIQTDNLQVQLDSLNVSYENLQASESTVRDTDMTKEMSNFTKYQVMMQAGTAMLAQANQMPNTLLQLLK